MIEITLPQIDENVVEYTIGVWLKNVGEWVDANDAIVEVESDKVTMEVVAESAGTMTEILAQPGDCLLYTSPSPRDGLLSRMPSSA